MAQVNLSPSFLFIITPEGALLDFFFLITLPPDADFNNTDSQQTVGALLDFFS